MVCLLRFNIVMQCSENCQHICHPKLSLWLSVIIDFDDSSSVSTPKIDADTVTFSQPIPIFVEQFCYRISRRNGVVHFGK